MQQAKTVTSGLVLRQTVTKETDLILTVLTPDLGKIPVIARGARRKNSRLAAACQLLAYSELTVYQKGAWYMLDEASTIELFDGVRQDFENLALASFFAELTESVAEEGSPAPELLRRLRAQLPGDIGVLTLTEAGPRFHARLSCRGKTYVYRVWNSDTPNVFERRYVHALPQPLDTAAMQRAAALLCGRHDYTSFCANRHMKKSAVRTVDAITVERLGDEVRLSFSGDGFLYHMVRILTGTLLEVGLGQRDAGTMADILAARDRAAAGPTAPARGLILWETRYACTHPEAGEEKCE